MTVRVERNGPVLTVILDRPERRNAVDGAHALDLLHAFEAFEQDDTTSVAVLWGAGGHFCAGADLKALGTPDGVDASRADYGPMGPTRLELTKPVIAAVAGFAVAGGLELALWCDLRVAEQSAVFGVYCRRWGVPLIDGGTVRLPRIVGTGRALDMVLTGRPVGADEALGFGLVNRVVPDGSARAAAEELAAQLARFPQTCMRSDRMSVRQQHGLDEATALVNERRLGLPAVAAEAIQGAAAFSSGKGRHGAFA